MIKSLENSNIFENKFKEKDLLFRDKEVDSSNNSVKLFFKNDDGSDIFWGHAFRVGAYISHRLIDGLTLRDINRRGYLLRSEGG